MRAGSYRGASRYKESMLKCTLEFPNEIATVKRASRYKESMLKCTGRVQTYK